MSESRCSDAVLGADCISESFGSWYSNPEIIIWRGLPAVLLCEDANVSPHTINEAVAIVYIL